MSGRRSASAVRNRTSSNASSSAMPSGPPSPTFTATTAASQVQLDSGPDTIITRRDLRLSINAYEDLVRDCQSYRDALITMSNAAARFASTLERCSRLKGVEDDAAIGLQAAGGLHHLMGNHWQVLNMTLLTGFEDPLRHELEQYKRTVSERSSAYEKALIDKSKVIKKTEAESVDTGRRKQRDLQSFRKTLATLQAHVDDLDRLKAAHYQQILEHEVKVWDNVMDKASLVVRSSLDVFERLGAKASDPMLEPLMQSVLDPFEAYGTKSENEIYSILPPLSITNHSSTALLRGPSPSPPVFNNNIYGNGTSNGSFYDQNTPSNMHHPSQSWADSSKNEWSNTPSSSTDDLRRYSVPSSPRRPSSPPSTDTLRRGAAGGKPRPSIINVEDVLSSDTIKNLDVPPLTPRRDSSRRDTIIAPRPARPLQSEEDADGMDDTVRFNNANDKKQLPPSPVTTIAPTTSKKSGFATFSRFISPSAASTGAVSKG